LEQEILAARRTGEISADDAFERLYRLYAPTVRGWCAFSIDSGVREDLCQDVWTIFFRRWRQWRDFPEMSAPEARPILSFLYRTWIFVVRGHRRRQKPKAPIDAAEHEDHALSPAKMESHIEFGRCLQVMKAHCSTEEQEVLLARLSGVPIREVARTLDITESLVDHRYRNAIARLQQELGARR
jgi:RNA polymerase sigma factor (sigma-70 family)